MRHIVVAVVVLAAALVAVSSAAAGNPYSFADRAAIERQVAKMHPSLELVGKRYSVRAVGCAKPGVGRGYCVVVVTSPMKGAQSYLMRMMCASDAPSAVCRFDYGLIR